MNTTETIANSVRRSQRGVLATLGGLLSFKGTGALAHGRNRPGRHARRLNAAGAGLGAVLVLCVVSPPALAAPGTGHGFSGTFGSAGSAAGLFNEPEGVAVNDASPLLEPVAGGDVYVVDKGNSRVERFGATGEYKGQFSGVALEDPTWVAVDNDESSPSHGDVYVTNNGHKVVDKFSATGVYLGQVTAGEGGSPFGELYGVAVDAEGKLWVYQSSGEIDDYSDAVANVFVASRPMPYAAAPGFTVGPEGDLYAMYPSAPNFFLKLDSLGNYLGNPWGSTELASAAAFESSGEAYVDNLTTVGAFSAAGALNQRFGGGHLTSGAGIAVNSETGSVYVADSTGDDVAVFTQGPKPEEPKTEPVGAGEVTPTTAMVHGELNPKGATGALTYQFDYNKGGSCAGGRSVPVPAAEVVEAKHAKVEAKVTGLEPSAQYTFCLVAIDTYGETLGNEVSATTKGAAPEVLSESASAPKETEATFETEATLAASINPNNQETTYTFEYSTEATGETLEGTITPVAGTSAIPAEEFGPQGVSVLTGSVLTPETLYYYRVLATDATGTSKGQVEHFTTGPPERPETLEPGSVTTTTAVLRGVLNPHKPGDPGTYKFAYQEGSSCHGRFTGSGKAAGAEAEHVATEVTGLLPNATYSVCVFVENEAEQGKYGPPVTFTTLSVTPTLAAEAATHITTETAVLNATVDPESLPVLTCTFEYVPQKQFEEEKGLFTGVKTQEKAPCEHPNATELGTGRTPVTVSDEIEKLEPNTEYHWRIVATNAAGTSTSPDHTFFYPTGGAALPDGRAYEMVTPPDKNGALIGVGADTATSTQESADGTRVLAGAIQCLLGSEGCTADNRGAGQPYEFLRTASGWVTHPLSPPATALASNSFKIFNADADTALFEAPNPQHPGRKDLYARAADGVFSDVGPVAPEGVAEIVNEPVATPDLSHVLYELREARWPGDETHAGRFSLYEYEGVGNSEPRLVGVSGGVGSKQLESVCGTFPGDGTSEYGALSEDGETVYFRTNPCTAQEKVELYVRYEHARTEQVSTPAPAGEACDAECLAQPAGDARFQSASADGSGVFFTDTQQLTDSASEDSHAGDSAEVGCSKTTVGFSGCNLYESICPNRCAVAGSRELVDVSAGENGVPVPGGPRVRGVVAISTDGSHVYFVAQGVLTSTANGQGQLPQDGLANLYAYERDASAPTGRLAFVTTLSSTDSEQWTGREGGDANVTPDGRFLVFTSHRALTPDDIRGEGPAQVYRYDAGSGSHPPTLVRISIGEQGFNDNGNAGLVGEVREAGDTDTGDAHIVPNQSSADGGIAGPRREDPTMSDDGQYVFFQSPVGLTPQALNDMHIVTPSGYGNENYAYAQNVYEYHEGQVSLLSDGRDTNTAEDQCPAETRSATCLLGSDASGHNVFFKTADSLVPADTDTQIDIYDARICEASSPCIQPAPAVLPPCLEEACHGTPAAIPSLLTPGTASFNGQGNVAPAAPAVKSKSLTRAQKLANALRACRKNKKKSKRQSCEKQARDKYAPAKKKAKAKNSTNGRRGK